MTLMTHALPSPRATNKAMLHVLFSRLRSRSSTELTRQITLCTSALWDMFTHTGVPVTHHQCNSYILYCCSLRFFKDIIICQRHMQTKTRPGKEVPETWAWDNDPVLPGCSFMPGYNTSGLEHEHWQTVSSRSLFGLSVFVTPWHQVICKNAPRTRFR